MGGGGTSGSCVRVVLQERTRSFDGFSMHSLENSLIDIMRAEQDSLKGGFTHKHGGTFWFFKATPSFWTFPFLLYFETLSVFVTGRYSFSHQGGDGPLPLNGM